MTTATVTERISTAGAQRAVRLPSGRYVSLRLYVQGWRRVLRLSPHTAVYGWGHFPEDARDVLEAYRRGMHDRINARLPWWGKGRKWDAEWQRDARHCARMVNAEGFARLLVRPGDVPFDLRARLAHRITQPWEE